jgi:VanZ family protein
MQSRMIWLALWSVASAVVSILYLLPDAGPPGDFELDKLAHLVAFSAIGTATWPATQRRQAFIRLFLIGCVLAIGLECLQGWVPGRQFSVFDILANVVGIVVGTAAGRRLDGLLIRLADVRGLR